jgi:hypothetical protein
MYKISSRRDAHHSPVSVSEHHSKSTATAAILIAPWAVVPIVALALKGGPHLSRLEMIVSGIFMGTLFGVPLAYLAVLVVGYPAYKFLKAKGILNAWSLSAVGVVAGGLCGLAVVGPEALSLCATSGFAVAITAWLIIRKST